jgi:hypothetical protein
MSLTSSCPRVLRRILALLIAVVLISWGTAALSRADAVEKDQVCSGLDSGKIDTTGDPGSVTLTAPDGQLITGYCVKAGSEQSGDGPVYVTLDEPQQSVTITYPGGKAISHYSVDYGTAPPEDVCPDMAGDQPEGTDCTPDEGDDDVCPNMPGNQPEGTDCTPDEGDDDVCPNMPGNQPEGTDCTPDEGDDDVCVEGPHEGQPIPADQTESEFCGVGGPGGTGGPGGNTPGGNDAGETEVLGAQASTGAGALTGSSAPSAGAGAGAQDVPTAVNAGLEDPEATSTGLRSPLALLMVALGLFAFGMAIVPSRRTNPRHRQS